jgi:hypothetical protein
VLATFSAPHTAELADKRCASAVERVTRANEGGFAVRDLPFIDRLLNASYAYISKTGTRALDGPLCALVRCAHATPFGSLLLLEPLWSCSPGRAAARAGQQCVYSTHPRRRCWHARLCRLRLA